MTVEAYGTADVICWSCHRETSAISGKMKQDPNEYSEWAWGEQGPWFVPDELFVCPECGTEDDFAWTDFSERIDG